MPYLVTWKPSKRINCVSQRLLCSSQHTNVQKEHHSQIKPLGHFSSVHSVTCAVNIMCL